MITLQTVRRDTFLKKQNEIRQNIFNKSRYVSNKRNRDLQEEQNQPMELEDIIQDLQELSLTKNQLIKSLQYAKQLTQYDYITQIPENFEQDWVYTTISEGQRCLVICKHGKTIIRDCSGMIIDSIKSQFDGNKHSNMVSIFDCIKKDKNFYIVDLLMFKNQDFTDSPWDLRYFWINSHLQINNKNQEYTFSTIKTHPIEIQNHIFAKNNIYFHKQGWYVQGTTNPFILKKQYNFTNECILWVTKNGFLKTYDGIKFQKVQKDYQNKMLKVEYSSLQYLEDSFYLENLRILEIDKNQRLPNSLCYIQSKIHNE